MKKSKIIIISLIIIGIILVLSIPCILIYTNKDALFSSYKTESNINEKTTSKEETKSIETIPSKESNNSKEESTTTESSVTNKEETNYTSKDNTIISNMQLTLDDANTLSGDNIADKAKATFVSIVDFLFYDGSIDGVTFNELSASGKQKTLDLANKIDAALEQKAPGYKESIASGTKDAYLKASEVIKSGASNLNNFAQDKLGDENYESIIAAKDELVKYTKMAAGTLKETGSSAINKAKDKLSSWYQNFKSK